MLRSQQAATDKSCICTIYPSKPARENSLSNTQSRSIPFDQRVHSCNQREMSGPAILEVRQLTKDYASGGGTLHVLKEISFSLAASDSCAILGPSGSGKTTLLSL